MKEGFPQKKGQDEPLLEEESDREKLEKRINSSLSSDKRSLYKKDSMLEDISHKETEEKIEI